MTVLVLGHGQLGEALRQAIAARGWPSVTLDHASLDIADADKVAAAVARYRPWAVVNAAAYTAVDKAESEPELAMAVNGDGAGNVARAAAAAGAILLHMSTDYVFDGSKPVPYVETDPVNPISTYGRSKLAGERAVAIAEGRHLIIRTAWLFAAGGHNFVRTMLRLGRERGQVSVVTDQTGCPTPAAALAEALLTVLERAKQPGFADWGTYHLAGTPAVTWHGFARTIFAAAGMGVTVKPIDTATYGAAAPRPTCAVLDCGKAARVFGVGAIDWRPGLAEVLRELAVPAAGGAR